MDRPATSSSDNDPELPTNVPRPLDDLISVEQPISPTRSPSYLRRAPSENTYFDASWLGLRQYLMLIGILAASVTYNAGLTPPGGFWKYNTDGHDAGDPVLRVRSLRRYEVFFYSNSITFAGSLVLIILLLRMRPRNKIWTGSVVFTLTMDLFSLMVAYGAGADTTVKFVSFYCAGAGAVFIYVIISLIEKCVTSKKANRLNEQEQMIIHQNNDVEEARKFILIFGAFAAALTYQAGLRPPGGFWAENDQNQTPATAVLYSNYSVRYLSFLYCNSTSFVASLLVVVLTVSSGSQKRNILLRPVAAVDLISLIGAYVAGSPRDLATSFSVMFSAVGYLILLSILSYGPAMAWLRTVVIVIFDIDQPAPAENAGSNPTNHRGTLPENAESNPTNHRVKKSQTYLLLLAILVLCQTYRSGLNPPGGFWSNSEEHHSAGERILEDIRPSHFRAFFYLNASAFATSVLIIFVLLDPWLSLSNNIIEFFWFERLIIRILLRFHWLTEKETIKSFWFQSAVTLELILLSSALAYGIGMDESKFIYMNVLVCLVGVSVIIQIVIWKTNMSHIHRRRNMDTINHQITKQKDNVMLMIAILAASATYQASMNPPGGVWSGDRDAIGKPGYPILRNNHEKHYNVYFYTNSVSFFSSAVTTIFMVSKNGIKTYAMKSAMRLCLVVGMVSLAISYAAGSTRSAKQSMYFLIIYLPVLSTVVIQVIFSPLKDLFGRILTQDSNIEQGDFLNAETRWNGQKRSEMRRHKYMMLLTTLIAYMTYEAGLNPPGGFWYDEKGHKAGDPIIRDVNRGRYNTFFYSNTTSFVASILLIVKLFVRSLRKKGHVGLEGLQWIIRIDLLAVMTSFVAGTYQEFWSSFYLIVVVGCVVILLIYLTIVSILSLKRTITGISVTAGESRASGTIPPVLETHFECIYEG